MIYEFHHLICLDLAKIHIQGEAFKKFCSALIILSLSQNYVQINPNFMLTKLFFPKIIEIHFLVDGRN